jgi:hypothetical protein
MVMHQTIGGGLRRHSHAAVLERATFPILSGSVSFGGGAGSSPRDPSRDAVDRTLMGAIAASILGLVWVALG